VRQSAVGLYRCHQRVLEYAAVLKPGFSSEGFTFAADQANTLSLVTVADAPLSAPSALRIGFPEGTPGGGAPSRFGSHAFPANQGNVYVCVWVRMSADFSNNGNVGTKLFLHSRPVEQSLVGFDSPDRDRTAFVMTGLQFQDSRLSNNLGQVTTASDNIAGGAGHKVEVLWQANRPGQKDGRFRQWVDGVLTGQSNSAMYFLATQTPHWTSIWFDPTFGGGLHPVPMISSSTWTTWSWPSGNERELPLRGPPPRLLFLSHDCLFHRTMRVHSHVQRPCASWRRTLTLSPCALIVPTARSRIFREPTGSPG
jgi:hypothetical protein